MPYFLIVIGCLGLIMSMLGLHLPSVHNLDVAALSWMHLHRTNFFSEIALFLSYTGGLPATLCIFGLWCLQLYRSKKYKYIYLLCLGLLGGALTGWALKYMFDRARPDAMYQMVQTYGASFPSAHSLYAAILSCLVVLIYGRYHHASLILFLACIWSGCMGISRVYLGAHYPTDVLAGWSIALIWIGLLWLQLLPFMLNENKLILEKNPNEVE